MTTAARSDLLDAVDRVAPVIREHAAAVEQDRRIPTAPYAAMEEAGLFGMIAPAAPAGLEVHPTEALAVWEAVAWNLRMNQSVTSFAAWLPAEGANEIFQDGPATLAGVLNPPTAATRVDGGWRVSGQAPFASGCHNTRWLATPSIEMEGDDPKINPETGEPSPMAVFFPREEAEILDTWHTVGMRGTGSADISVTDLFVPDHRAVPIAPLSAPAPGFEGPLYRLFPRTAVLGESICSVGVAAKAVDDLVEIAQTKVPAYNRLALRDQPLAHYGAGRAKAGVDAARDTRRRGRLRTDLRRRSARRRFKGPAPARLLRLPPTSVWMPDTPLATRRHLFSPDHPAVPEVRARCAHPVAACLQGEPALRQRGSPDVRASQRLDLPQPLALFVWRSPETRTRVQTRWCSRVPSCEKAYAARRRTMWIVRIPPVWPCPR